MLRMNSSAAALLALSLTCWTSGAHADVRARDLGIPLHGQPGALNAITDVAGVEVGHKTLIEGTGELRVGTGPVRTGVTVVLPRGRSSTTPVFAGWSTLNAAGEMTGTAWLDERGLIDGPIAITNTHSVGVVRDAVIGWMVKSGWKAEWHAPVIAETYDGVLNDINGFHVRSEHVVEALDAARAGPVQEGSVGGGTGMICHRFKGGIGSSSRLAKHGGQQYVVGALVQCNYGERRSMRISGLPVGEELNDKYLPQRPRKDGARDGSIIVVMATDAPLLPHQLKRLSKRASLALGRMGSVAGAGSGDIFVAFSTANPGLQSVAHEVAPVLQFPNEDLTVLFEAAVDATEEAILNALVAARDMTGVDDIKIYALPHAEVRAMLNRKPKGK
jgi:D-aminopeptidase